ncbi:MAG: MerR family transcriptional regulator [Erysipelotrichaceae bacterium]|nr:MerR family transcriptional regulator [Erysipelotrichaceae bacterium]
MLISKVAKKFDLSVDTIRYYEKAGLIDPVAKDASGNKDYQEKELRRINFIKCMKAAGLSIENIRNYVDLFHEGLETIPQRKEILENQLVELVAKKKELDETIAYLRQKIENYEQTLIKREIENYHPDEEEV